LPNIKIDIPIITVCLLIVIGCLYGVISGDWTAAEKMEKYLYFLLGIIGVKNYSGPQHTL